MTSTNGPARPRRPLLLDAAALTALGGSVDPVQQIDAAHESAAVLLRTGRSSGRPELTQRLVAIVDEVGLDTLADLWAARPAGSLPGALWRLYALREWVRRMPREASIEYAAGMRFADVNHVVAGAAEPPGPDELLALVDAVLHGVFEGDFAVALERAAAFCRVVSAGRAASSEGEDAARQAAELFGTAEQLTGAAALWRAGRLS
ncbi:MAG: hypothetical protein IPL45_11790 [Actinomycetales bacterium]|nr:hypothetical protein [Actinomycetales bacterium]